MIILRKNFAAARIVVITDTTDPKEEVCVDLSVGDSYMEAGSSESLTTDGQYFLKPGRCIIIRTAEELSIPNDVFGLLCSKGSLSLLGFFVPNTKVDPLFSGKLDIALYNAGKKELSITKEKKFCSIIFQKIDGSTTSTLPRGVLRVSTEKTGKFLAFCQEHAVLLVTSLVTILISIGCAVATTLLTLKHH